MNIESFEQLKKPSKETIQAQEKNIPVFEKREPQKGITHYLFDHVGVAIDTTGKNYTELPEIMFGTYDSKQTASEKVFTQPDVIRKGVDMKYISACIREVARDSGIKEFWLFPHGEDASSDNKKREEARFRLFRRYIKLTPAPNNFGYIMKL